MDARQLAERFHEVYERLAPSFGYETRTETRRFDPDSKNGRLMIATCTELLQDALGGGDERQARFDSMERTLRGEIDSLKGVITQLRSAPLVAREDMLREAAERAMLPSAPGNSPGDNARKLHEFCPPATILALVRCAEALQKVMAFHCCTPGCKLDLHIEARAALAALEGNPPAKCERTGVPVEFCTCTTCAKARTG